MAEAGTLAEPLLPPLPLEANPSAPSTRARHAHSRQGVPPSLDGSASSSAAVARPTRRSAAGERDGGDDRTADHVHAFCLSAGFSEQLPRLLEQKIGRRVTWNAHREAIYAPLDPSPALSFPPTASTPPPPRARSLPTPSSTRLVHSDEARSALRVAVDAEDTETPLHEFVSSTSQTLAADGTKAVRIRISDAEERSNAVVGTPDPDSEEPMMYFTQNRVNGGVDSAAADAVAAALGQSARVEAGADVPVDDAADTPAFSHARNPDSLIDQPPSERAVIFFDFGVVVFWGCAHSEAASILHDVVEQCAVDPFHARFVETDELVVRYLEVGAIATPDADANASGTVACELKDDVALLPLSLRGETATRMAIAYALAQSTRLSTHEEMAWETATRLRLLPVELNVNGSVGLSRRQLSKFIGSLYVQRSSLAMLRHALDKPEYFWNASDLVSRLYTDVAGYLEIEHRLEALNRRMDVVNDTLTMLRDQQNHLHGERLEWIVIILILIEVVVGLVDLLSRFGYFAGHHG